MRNDPLIYYRTRKPFDVDTLERLDHMTGDHETRCTYPVCFKNAASDLLFRYRDDGSATHTRWSPCSVPMVTSILFGCGATRPTARPTTRSRKRAAAISCIGKRAAPSHPRCPSRWHAAKSSTPPTPVRWAHQYDVQ